MFCRKTNSSSNQLTLLFGAIVTLFAFQTFQGCQPRLDDTPGFSGKWTVIVAYRNGQSTSTLEDAFFDFESDSTFVTNIFETSASYPYSRTTDGFKQLGSEEVIYTVDKNGADTMLIQTTIRNYNFSFVAIRDTSKVEEILQ